jgi:exodeoxyribonuclease VII large subunit
MFANDFALKRISVQGEISNCKYHSSGHIYFTLKDVGGTLSAVMFASRRGGLSFRLEDGMQVEAEGSIEVYERSGTYQLYARAIRQAGLGELYEKFVPYIGKEQE